MKNITRFILAATVVLFALATNATADDLSKAVDKAFAGKESKKVNVGGHEFNIKPPTIIKNGKNIGATGQISHHLSWRKDDQVTYKIQIKDGQADVTHSITRGGLGRMVGVPGKLADVGGKVVDGSWEASCLQIINAISLKLVL